MEYKKDFEELWPYFEAFWNCEVLDRVAVSITAPKTGSPQLKYKWHKPAFVALEPVERVLDEFEKEAGTIFYGGLAVPQFWANFGPDVFSAFLGAKINYSKDSEETSWADWSDIFLKNYDRAGDVEISDSNPLYKKHLEFLKTAVRRGKGRYIVGHTDLHAGFDSIAVLRGGPDIASMDLVENPEGVHKLMQVLFRSWKKTWDDYYGIVKNEQPGTSAWIGIWAPGKTYPVQNDFSCLVSPGMYREFFLDELVAEIEYLDYSIYHLDGPEALQHLDILLDIPKLNAIQWISGARSDAEGIGKWIPLYKKIQEKKKSIVVYPKVEEIDLVLENLKPEGLLIQASCASEEEAKAVMKKLGW